MKPSFRKTWTEENRANQKSQLSEKKKILLKSYRECLKENLPVHPLPSLLKTVISAAKIIAILKIRFDLLMLIIRMKQSMDCAIIVGVVLLMPRGILGVLQQKYNLPRTI